MNTLPVVPWIKKRFWEDGSTQIRTEARRFQSGTWDKGTSDTEKKKKKEKENKETFCLLTSKKQKQSHCKW